MPRLSKSSRLGSILVAFFIAILPTTSGLACPFCNAVSQTLRQEMDQSDAVAFAKIVAGSESDSDALFKISAVIKGESFIREGQEIRVNYFGKAKPDQHFMIMGVDPPDMLWSSPLPVSPTNMDYVRAVSALPAKDSLARLRFYIRHLEHAESFIARDTYDEFASAPYAEIKTLKPDMDRGQLLKWIQDTNIPPDRKRLYLVMLGVCGQAEDAKLLEELLRSDDPNRRAGLDSMIACYATLKGDAGLALIDELFLANKQSQYADTYAAIMALRFHGTEGGVIDKKRILKSMQLILERPELADLVIPDLARWEDWSQVDKLVELFKGADEKSSWVRVPVINYLRACPLPEASAKIEELKELDPAAFKRATSFFPIPKAAAAESTDSSYIAPVTPEHQYATSDASKEPDSPSLGLAPAAAGQQYASAAIAKQAAHLITPKPIFASASLTVANPGWTVSVISIASVTLWIAMWLTISGAGRLGPVARILLASAPASRR
ncbi:MAG: hypothetical protein R3C53_14185 [Pirellulaceae bacterium]